MSDRVERRPIDRVWVARGRPRVGLVILGHGVRAVVSGWIPTGDDGYWAIMARSVFSSRPPLLGSSSSGGVVTGTGFHLGPLGFYLLAPFVAVFGGVGVAIGAAVVNAAAAVIAPVAVRRGVGERAGWVVVVATAVLAFTMGSELLVDPWNPHLAVLSLWCALCCAWAVLAGGVAWGAAGVFFVSLSLQTHLSFVPVAGIAGVVLLVGTAWGCAHRERVEGSPWWRRWLPLFAALGAGLVANLVVADATVLRSGAGQPDQRAEQRHRSGAAHRVSRPGARTVAQAFDPTNWLPGSWFPQVIRPAELASPWLLVGVFVVLVGLEVLAVRRRSTRSVPALTLVLVLVVVSVWVAAGLGLRIGVPMTLARWAWPVALLTVAVVVDVVVGMWIERTAVDAQPRPARSPAHRSRRWCAGWLAAGRLLCAANVVPATRARAPRSCSAERSPTCSTRWVTRSRSSGVPTSRSTSSPWPPRRRSR